MSDSSAAEDGFVSIPRGGPIYFPDMVGPLTNVSEFQSAIEAELKDLRTELCSDLIETHRHEISVDELKILSNEELVDKAVEALFMDGNVRRNTSPSPREQPMKSNDCRMIDEELACSVKSGRDGDCVPSDKSSKRSRRTNSNVKMNGKVSKSSKGATPTDTTQEERYVEVVEQVSRIKQKQEEDKSAARLHSFNGASENNACVTLSSEKKERMSSLTSTSYSTKVKSSSTHEQIPIHGPEVVFCIEVYHSQRSSVKTQEILVLGQQSLTELRDKIYCLTDELSMKLSKQHDPSGYFLIEDVFYNDRRDPRATDYSAPILDWVKESRKEALEKWEWIISGELQPKQKELLGSGNVPDLPRFKSVAMHTRRFRDLSFRLGAAYLYCHQGDCKHVVVIREMRAMHPEDVTNGGAYPLVFQPKLRFHKCAVCNIYKAEKVTVDDKWVPDNPCYFCGMCYYMLHYADNHLVYHHFKVFDCFTKFNCFPIL